jgi:polyisoprenoid-binding protein YceI
MTRKFILIASAAVALATPAIAQLTAPAATPPSMVRPAGGTPNVALVTAGTYAVDSHHTQVAFAVNHLGFNVYHGIFGGGTGSLILDPRNPGAASVSIDIPIAEVVTTRQALTEHLQKPEFFDVANSPLATFRSTRVTVRGTRARIAGNLTMRGVTRPVVLDAHFTGAGINPMNKKPTIGFEGSAVIKRSDFGIMYGLPGVGEMVDLQITAAFEKAP